MVKIKVSAAPSQVPNWGLAMIWVVWVVVVFVENTILPLPAGGIPVAGLVLTQWMVAPGGFPEKLIVWGLPAQ
jgi:hypothetical protein